jgi:hypothetical protein
MYYNRVKERKARQEKFRQKWREYINESSWSKIWRYWVCWLLLL